MLYLCKEVSAMWVAVIAEFIKRRDVRLVNSLVLAFVPVGCLARAVSPLIDAAFYHRKHKSNRVHWNWHEVFMEDNTVSIFVLEPRHIDSLLDDRVLIWVMGHPAEVEFTVDECHIGQQGVRKPCIVADAIWSSTGVKSI